MPPTSRHVSTRKAMSRKSCRPSGRKTDWRLRRSIERREPAAKRRAGAELPPVHTAQTRAGMPRTRLLLGASSRTRRLIITISSTRGREAFEDTREEQPLFGRSEPRRLASCEGRDRGRSPCYFSPDRRARRPPAGSAVRLCNTGALQSSRPSGFRPSPCRRSHTGWEPCIVCRDDENRFRRRRTLRLRIWPSPPCPWCTSHRMVVRPPS
jgi:hypothetical protein